MASDSKKLVVGIDIGSLMTRVIVAEEAPKLGTSPKIIGIGYSESRGMHHVLKAKEPSRRSLMALAVVVDLIAAALAAAVDSIAAVLAAVTIVTVVEMVVVNTIDINQLYTT